MVKIKVHTERVREGSTKFKTESDHQDQIVGELQRALGRLDTGSWDGRSRAKAEPLLRRVRPEGTRVVEELGRLGQTLQRVAERFEQEDASAAQNLSGMPWVDFESQGGQVLGVAAMADLQAIYGLSASARSAQTLGTTEVVAAAIASHAVLKKIAAWLASLDFSKMTWAERFNILKSLQGGIAVLLTRLNALDAIITKDDAGIADLQGQIDELKKKREELQKEADRWGNKIARSEDGGWGFDDGPLDAPWRTKSDDYEDEIAELDEQIASLEAEKSQLEADRQRYLDEQEDVAQQLQVVQEKQASLNQLFTDGIAKDGPSEWHDDFPGTKSSNCTKYASSQRDVPCRGNAYQWLDQASSNGYETGSLPVKGAVMVQQPGIHGANVPNGHVAIVERVEVLDNGNFKVYYTDNRHTDPSKPTSVTLTPNEVGTGFIYGKSSEMQVA